MKCKFFCKYVIKNSYILLAEKISNLASYRIDYEEFFSYLHDPTQKELFEKLKELCREPMNQLIKKYNLHSKKVLSIGPGAAFEEYWFYKNGCQLTLLDIDESKSIEPILKKIEQTEEGNFLKYIIDDANNYKKYLNEKYDVVYFSSFTPNELTNRAIRHKYQLSIVRRGLNPLSRKTKINFLQKQWTWPHNEKPFIDFVMEIMETVLGTGGLVIHQSYASDIDTRSINYIDRVKEQLDSINIRLLAVYYFIDRPHVKLIIGYKNNLSEAIKFATKIKNNPEINSFHGRGIAIIKKFHGIKKIYDILN